MTRIYIAIDLETTGLDPYTDGIVELGAVKFIEDGSIIDTFESLADPGIPISLNAGKLHGIKQHDLKGKPSPKEVWIYFLDWASNDHLAFVAHNAGFEIGFLRSLYRDTFKMPEFQFVDTLTLSRRRLPNLISYRLVDLVPDLGCNSHRALADAKACSRLLVRIAGTYKSGKLPASAIKPASQFETVDNRPTRRQLDYIKDLGGDIYRAKTKEEASKYIDQLKEGDILKTGNIPSSKFLFWIVVTIMILLCFVLAHL